MDKRTFLLAAGAWSARPALALYDPKPNPLLASGAGSWRGTLVYRDYQQPDRLVTLQARLTVAPAGPDEWVLFYVFDDGPGKTVYSYERMAFDFARSELVWTSGAAKPERSVWRITAAAGVDGDSRLQFEKAVEGGVDRYGVELASRHWSLTKTEVRAGQAELRRNRYEWTRADA